MCIRDSKFTGEGGKVTFSAAQRKKTKNGAVLRFIVNDTGVGMSEQFLPHLFEPFSQESTGTTSLYGGTGLGPVSYTHLDVYKRQAQGCAFGVSPLPDGAVSPSPRETASLPFAGAP